jgi:hypothetical protein
MQLIISSEKMVSKKSLFQNLKLKNSLNIFFVNAAALSFILKYILEIYFKLLRKNNKRKIMQQIILLISLKSKFLV